MPKPTTRWVCPICHQAIWGCLDTKVWHLEKHEDARVTEEMKARHPSLWNRR